MDTKLHKRVTGYGNETILKNLTKLANVNPAKIIVTIPVIPNIKKIKSFYPIYEKRWNL